jgi:predicted nucleotidyltransferase component of viral defense system
LGLVFESINMNILTTFQVEFINSLSKTSLKDAFFLTGGTALSEFYLQHRISDDLDFFTEEEGQIAWILPIIEDIASELGGKIDITRNFRSYIEFFIIKENEFLRCDFAMDSPYRLNEKVFNNKLGIYTDNAIDISCNKLSALFDRSEPKDFVDIYFIDKEIIRFDRLVEKAKKKHIGLDNYWLAISLAKIDSFSILPRMLKPLTIDELRYFFKEKSQWLMKQ